MAPTGSRLPVTGPCALPAATATLPTPPQATTVRRATGLHLQLQRLPTAGRGTTRTEGEEGLPGPPHREEDTSRRSFSLLHPLNSSPHTLCTFFPPT
uniref:Uncharacterized protein n=1 Tax=Ixodes scapularis TaxID=6945 RepID=A0A4D5RFH5_IXOSC